VPWESNKRLQLAHLLQIFADLVPGLEKIVHPNVAITAQEVIQLNNKINNLTKGDADFSCDTALAGVLASTRLCS
jgi:hypothetical protein